jgi:Zn-dependent protease
MRSTHSHAVAGGQLALGIVARPVQGTRFRIPGDRTVPAQVVHALVFWLPAFLFSATVHEAAHAWVALRMGDPTAYLNGQVSLSPWPHVRRSPIGMLIIPLLTSLTQGWTMGWASAPYDPAWAERHPRRVALMSLAGPLGNLVIAAGAFVLIQAGLALGAFEPPQTATIQQLVLNAMPPDPIQLGDFLAKGLSVLLALNVLLFAFNLLPLPPLDGASVLTLLLPGKAARAMRKAIAAPGLSFVGLVAAWQLFPALTTPVIAVVVHVLYPAH